MRPTPVEVVGLAVGDPAAVEGHRVTDEVAKRNGDTAGEVFLGSGGDDAQGLKRFLLLLTGLLLDRPGPEADLQAAQDFRDHQAAALQVVPGLTRSLQLLPVEGNHIPQRDATAG